MIESAGKPDGGNGRSGAEHLPDQEPVTPIRCAVTVATHEAIVDFIGETLRKQCDHGAGDLSISIRSSSIDLMYPASLSAWCGGMCSGARETV